MSEKIVLTEEEEKEIKCGMKIPILRIYDCLQILDEQCTDYCATVRFLRRQVDILRDRLRMFL